MRSQLEKATAFQALHERAGAFLLPNPWDAGSARLLERLGFEALATTSAGAAFAAGRPDNSTGRERMMEHIEALAQATDLPLSADLENGFDDTPAAVAETIRRAAAAGAVGGSIEDARQASGEPLYELALAADRIRAAAEAARSLPFRFMLTARAENYLVGRPDLDDTIRRLQAYQEAGADVLFAPGLRTEVEIATVVRAIDRPLNVIMGLQGVRLDLATLSALGVRRVSVGSALARTAFGALLRAAQEMRTNGTFMFVDEAVPYSQLNAWFER